MKRLAVIISPNWHDYAKKYLADCLASLAKQTLKDFDIFLVDNESNKESLNFLKNLAPKAIIIPLEKNKGFAGGNNAALNLVLEKNYEYVFLLNMDAMVEPDCLEKILKVADFHPRAAAIQARLMLWPKKDLINSLGNATHFLGFGYCQKYQQTFNEKKDNKIKKICYASGASVLYRVESLKKVGLFDENFWMYNEDQDICLRFWLAGFSVLLAPEAIVYHQYDFSRSITKYYYLDRNRLLVVLKNYHWLTILLLLPMFVIMEFGTFLFSLKNGWYKEKIRVWQYFLNSKNWSYIFKERYKIQSQRKIKERQFKRLLSSKIWYQEINDWRLRLINPFFKLYWFLIKLIIIW